MLLDIRERGYEKRSVLLQNVYLNHGRWRISTWMREEAGSVRRTQISCAFLLCLIGLGYPRIFPK